MPIAIYVRTILLGLVVASLAPSAISAQTPPPPKMEAELVAAGNKPLTGQQISALLLGNTAYMTFLAPIGKAVAGTQVKAFYRDAKTRVVAPGPGDVNFQKYQANWWIDGSHVCHETQVARQGHSCLSLYRASSAVYGCGENGICHFMIRVVPGNPDKL